ncbi:cytochrome P450 [Leucosporidium creatinivorum]|uniref:Cytochrome P450 n=1 Tax=Leucosporidium creatinivorum TaxID=106004 RepID=A0A1Y2FLB0_9BASI|nr:cytochrome P450 [Leucosporidium creatinivorum]
MDLITRITLPPLLPTLLAVLTILLTALLYRIVVRSYFSSLCVIPGPPSKQQKLGWPSLSGNFQESLYRPTPEWSNREQQGAIRYSGALGEQALVVTDPAAVQHILSHHNDFPPPKSIRKIIGIMVGEGLLFAQGDAHRRQRKIMNPSFAPLHLRELLPSFFEATYKLRDKWIQIIKNPPSASTTDEQDATPPLDKPSAESSALINLSQWMPRLTLDIIGLAGFGYSFHQVTGDSTGFADAFNALFSNKEAAASVLKPPSPTALVLITIAVGLLMRLPIGLARWLPGKEVKDLLSAMDLIKAESRKVIEEKKRKVEKDGVGSLGGGRDLITLLLRSNLGAGSSALSDVELEGQIATLLLAGNDTSSLTLIWTLSYLARNPTAQARLRTEIRDARRSAIAEGRDELSHDDLESLSFLDAVVRETLRLEPPAAFAIRTSLSNTQVPLSKPLNTSHGQLPSLPVTKNVTLVIPFASMNRDPAVFGEDAEEWRPERWLEGAGEGGVGIYSHIMTFSAGPRACIGYKFALLEIKAVLATLLTTFNFAPRDSTTEYFPRTAILTRPLVKGEEDEGFKCELRVGLVDEEAE